MINENKNNKSRHCTPSMGVWFSTEIGANFIKQNLSVLKFSQTFIKIFLIL
jgi:hypothetical protein